MVDLDEEIQNTLHAKPITGTLGNDALDFFIKQAELFIASARADIQNMQPRGPYDAHKAEAAEALRLLISQLKYNINLQIASIDQSVELTKANAEGMFQRSVSRPQNVTEEALNRRWESYRALFDSLTGNAVFARLKDEMRKVAIIYGGDALSAYLLRDGEGLMTRYLESRKLSLDSYYQAVQETTHIIEGDLADACASMLLGRRLERSWPAIRQRLRNQADTLDALSMQQQASWIKPAASEIKVQSQNDGGVNVTFPDIASFREWARTPHFRD